MNSTDIAAQALGLDEFAEICHAAHIDFCLDKFPSYERAIEHHYLGHLNRCAAALEAKQPLGVDEPQQAAPGFVMVPLTNEQIDAISNGISGIQQPLSIRDSRRLMARKVEAAHGIAARPLTASPTAQPSVEPVGERRQYFYKVFDCKARDADEPGCICWHDEGTGPLVSEPERIKHWRTTPPPAPVLLSDAWISVDERLPEPWTDVLISPRPTDYCCEGQVDHKGQWTYAEYEAHFGQVTHKIQPSHWMPLPPPPIEQAIGRASREASK